MGVFGLPFFGEKAMPGWIDVNKKPGRTSQAEFYAQPWATLKSHLNWAYFWNGGQVWWFAISALIYYFFPYDFEAAKEGFGSWVGTRLLINVAVTDLYCAAWYIPLYVMRLSKRKFNEHNDGPTSSRLFHNIWYTTCGAIQWTVWEAFFIRCYATGRIAYVSDAAYFSTTKSMVLFMCASYAVPLVREFHFYFCHRFLHINAIYTYVHKVHHRNTDVEPFSGLCMHPVEILYYFASVYPSLFFLGSPFFMLYNGMHLVLSPAGAHCGYEDMAQSDQFHFCHHQRLECNYGTASFPMDRIFGTSVDRLVDPRAKTQTKTTYKGEGDHKITLKSLKQNGAGPLSLKASLPLFDDFIFHVVFLALGGFICYLALLPESEAALICSPFKAALLMGFGPIITAFVLRALFGGKKSKVPFRWPFTKEKYFGAFGLHAVVGTAKSVGPVFFLVYITLSPAGTLSQSIPFEWLYLFFMGIIATLAVTKA